MSDKVDGRCSNCGERKLVMAGKVSFYLWCQACGHSWGGRDLGDLVEAAVLPAWGRVSMPDSTKRP